MSDPERPVFVPENAVYRAERSEWDLGELDEQGRPNGPHLFFRADGSLSFDCRYENGVLEGPFRQLHPDGNLARRGEHRGGKVHGPVEAFVSPDSTSEHLRSCCVPPGAHRLEAEYDYGIPMFERFYDEGGQLLLSDGSAHPDRPSTVPKDARFAEPTRRWVTGSYTSTGERQGMFRCWSTPGVLIEEHNYADGKLSGMSRTYDENGRLIEETNFEAGQLSGPTYRILPRSRVYTDDRIRQERGTYARHLALGLWTFLDERGVTVREADLGVPLDDPESSVAFSPEARSAAEWQAIARACFETHRTGEALCALARAAVVSGDKARFAQALDQARPLLVQERATALAEHAVEAAKGNITVLVDALLRGGDPAALFRAIALSHRNISSASLAFVDAALLLAPERSQFYVTRTLINLSLGDPDSAAQDTAHLGDELTEQREFLESYRRALYRPLDFWPAETELDSLIADMPSEPCQSLGRIRQVIQKYALRLETLRGAILGRVKGQPSWQLPDLSSLLREGEVTLDRREFEVCLEEDDSEPGLPVEAGDVEHVVVDESLELAALDVASLLRLVRADWSALTWLCWSAGLDRVALPETVASPPEFAQAVGMAIERHWRSHDKLSTAGLRALTKGIRGFVWEGLDIDTISPVFAKMAAHEYTDLRAMFFFLCDDRQQCPWQDNLRRE